LVNVGEKKKSHKERLTDILEKCGCGGQEANRAQKEGTEKKGLIPLKEKGGLTRGGNQEKRTRLSPM